MMLSFFGIIHEIVDHYMKYIYLISKRKEINNTMKIPVLNKIDKWIVDA